MPTLNWLKREFHYGYDSGNILSYFPNAKRKSEESKIGGSYRNIFYKAIKPYLQKNSHVLELGPGKGSWTRAILSIIPYGELHTLDYVDVKPWLLPDQYKGRLICHTVEDNNFSCVEDGYFDFYWSFGVLNHNNLDMIRTIFKNSIMKMKPGAFAVHNYGDWNKLDIYGWSKGAIPINFKNLPDDEIWWPRNDNNKITGIARETGWKVVNSDLDLVKRDGMILLQRP